jgi:hypothetical protein
MNANNELGCELMAESSVSNEAQPARSTFNEDYVHLKVKPVLCYIDPY